jgi:hypothetical protein
MYNTELLIKFEQRKKELQEERRREEERKELAVKAKELALKNKIDKQEKEMSRRDMMEREFRDAMAEARLKREDATYRDLIDASDKMQKHLNILDGVGQDQFVPIMIVPSVLLNRDAPHIIEQYNNKKLIEHDNAIQEQTTSQSVLCEKEPIMELQEVGEGNKEHKEPAKEGGKVINKCRKRSLNSTSAKRK